MPYQQHFYNGATLYFVVRGAIDPAMLSASVERKARERSPEVSVRVTTLNALPGGACGDAEVSSVAAESLRRPSAVSRHGGGVRGDGLRRGTAVEGDRLADGARCESAEVSYGSCSVAD